MQKPPSVHISCCGFLQAGQESEMVAKFVAALEVEVVQAASETPYLKPPWRVERLRMLEGPKNNRDSRGRS